MLAHFAIRLLAGIALMLGIMPREKVASGFFRVMMLVLLGMSVLIALSTAESPMLPIATAVVAFVGSVLWMLERRKSGSVMIFALAALSLLQLLQSSLRPDWATTQVPQWLTFASEFVSTALLGSTLTGMLLGHRYLTAPGMPLSPLLYLNHVLGAAAVCRLLLSAALLAVTGTAFLDSTYATWLGLRWLAGIAGPLMVYFMVRQILTYRNTQAATGVLFVGVILTFIGELTADLLHQALHLPF